MLNNTQQRKMKKEPKETNVAFVTRLIDYAEEPLTLRMAIDRVHKRTWKPTEVQMRNALKSAVANGGVFQKRDVHYKRIVYYSNITPLQAANIYEGIMPEDERKEEVQAIVHDWIDERPLQLEDDAIEASRKERPTITGLVTVTMDADSFVENLHRLDAQLYERVLDAIGDSIGVGGSWSRDDEGNMVYEVKI